MLYVRLLAVAFCRVVNEGDEPSFTQPYSLFSGADDYSEPNRSDPLEQEMIDLITLQRLLCLVADDTPSKVSIICIKWSLIYGKNFCSMCSLFGVYCDSVEVVHA